MIIVTDCSKDIKIPAGLGDNAGVVYETTGVKSVNGEQGDVTLKTVNGETLTGEGNIEIQAGVTSVNGQTGDLNLKTVNGNDLLGEGNIEIQASTDIEWMIVNEENMTAIYDEVSSHWENGNYTGNKMFKYLKDGKTLFATNVQYLTDHSVSFVFLNGDNYSVDSGNAKILSVLIFKGQDDVPWTEHEMESKQYIFQNIDIRSREEVNYHNKEVFEKLAGTIGDYRTYNKRNLQMFYIADKDEEKNEWKAPYYLIQNIQSFNKSDGEFNADQSIRASVIWYDDDNNYTQKLVCLTSNGGVISLQQMTDGYTLRAANSYTDEAIKNIPSGYTAGGKKIVLNDLTQDEYKAIREKAYAEMKASGHTEDTYYYKNGEAQSIEITSINYEEENNTVTNVEFDGFTANLDRWKFSINADNEFNVIENGSRAKITDIDWYPNSIATISFQVKMYGDDRDKDKGLFINTISSSMFNDTVYGTPFVIYFRAGFGDTSMFTTGAVAYNIDDDKYFEFIFKNYNYRYHLNGDYQIIAIEKEYIAFDDTTLCNVQADFSLSKEDTNISLYTYGVGSRKNNWDVYINGDYRTVQTLTVMPTDGSPRSKVPVTFDCMKDDKKAVFYFELHGYRYTYTQVEGNSWKFTSKEKIVTPADIANKVTSTSISNIVVLSQTEYDALGTKDANTMYCIKD